MTEGQLMLLACENGSLHGFGLQSRKKVILLRNNLHKKIIYFKYFNFLDILLISTYMRVVTAQFICHVKQACFK